MRIVNLLTEERYLAGEYITQEGQKSENFYVILKGECEAFTRDAEGTAFPSHILKKDDHFGEHSLLSDEAIADCCILAKTDVKVLWVGRRDFESHLGRFSEKVRSSLHLYRWCSGEGEGE